MDSGILLFGATGGPVLAGLVLFWIWSSNSQGIKEKNKYRISNNEERYHDARERHIRAIIGRIEAFRNELYAHREQQKHHEARRALLERVGVVAAVTAAWLAGISAWIFYLQFREARAEQRPWVYAVDVMPAGHIIAEKGLYIVPLKFSITNTGHTPAFFVTPKTGAAILPFGTKTSFSIRNEECDIYRTGENKIGGTVFPGQTITHGGFTSDDYPSVGKQAWDTATGHRLIVIYGCIDYQFPDAPGHHQSRFSFAVGEAKDQGILNRIGPLPDDPTTMDIRLMSITIGDGDKPAD